MGSAGTLETTLYIHAELLREQVIAVLTAWGMDADRTKITAELMVETDLRGIDSHGISMLILYDQMYSTGQLKLNADPRIVRESATTALIDAGAGLGHAVSVMAMEMAIEKATVSDIGVVSVFNSHHFGAAGLYAEMAARKGLIGIVSCSTKLNTVVPTFGTERLLGTNPFAFAAPSKRHPIVILDMSTSIVAANKVKAYALRKQDLPNGWLTTPEGGSLTDSQRGYELLFEGVGGGLSPLGGIGSQLGGHKGYGLGIFAQILSSTLGGGSFSPLRNRTQKPGDGDNVGQFFQAINPSAFRPLEDFQSDLDDMIDTLRHSNSADPAQPVMIPGDPEWRSRREGLEMGIPLSQSLADKIAEIAGRAGAPYLLGNG